MARHPKANKGIGVKKYSAKYQELGSVQAVARHYGVSRSVVQRSLKTAGIVTDRQKMLGELGGISAVKREVPKTGVKRYLITAAQNDTKVNNVFWNRLLELGEFYGAEVLVCPFTYSPVTSRTVADNPEPGWDKVLAPYITTDRIQLAPGLVLCAEITRVLPTAARPLSGMEAYTGRASGIFPHAKIAMESVPSMKEEQTKFNYTTGCVTRHNYSRTKAGFKGEFHHAYAALIVEVTAKGWWVRQINADSQNRIYDLDICVDEDGVTYDNTVSALIYGDVHVAELDPQVKKATWGAGGLVDFLRPETQVFHDLFDMRSRPWQDELSFHRQFEKHVKEQESVSEELDECHEVFTYTLHRDFAESVIVRSNHDIKLEKWLDTSDYRRDLVNASFFLRAQLAKVEAIQAGDAKFKVLEWALRERGLPDNVRFLCEDESFIICKNKGGGIECGQHGHLGPNGSKGTPRGIAKMARKQFIGDKHSPCIVDGLYVVGTCTGRDVAYTRGPSSWSPTHGVAYENGKRALLTMWDGRFFAPRDDLSLVA